ncbi:MAG: 50S ribosomal protein L21 [Actinomycetota bacterium]
MYAVIRVGGKQERVHPGDVIEVEFMKVDPGSEVEFQPLLVVDDQGKAHSGKELAKGKVTATLLGDKKGDKIRVFKYKNKSGYRRQMGHRQMLTLLEIQEVGISPEHMVKKPEAPAPVEPASKPAAAKKAAAKKPAAKKAAAKKPAGAKKAAAKKTAAKKPTTRKKTT